MTSEEWKTIKYFKPEEFDSPDSPGSGQLMDVMFVRALDNMREQCGFPFTIDSGFRTAEHNKDVGGVDSSAHTKGCGADISTAHRFSGVSTYRRYKMIQAAFICGIKRIGIGDTFLHFDMDSSLPSPRIWIYK